LGPWDIFIISSGRKSRLDLKKMIANNKIRGG
jgi:hypothetical protein